jgi:chromosome segregation ATPase
LESAQEQESNLQEHLEILKMERANCQSELSTAMKQLGEQTRSLESTQNNLVISREMLHDVEGRCTLLSEKVQQLEANLISVQSECNMLKESLVKAEVITILIVH